MNKEELAASIIQDIIWEEEQKSKGIKGWALAKLFINKLEEEYGDGRTDDEELRPSQPPASLG